MINLIRSLLLIVIFSIANITITGCNPSSLESTNTKVPRLVQSILSDPKTFNFIISTDAGTSQVEGMLFDGLISQNPITGNAEPALAESWTVSEDKLRIVFTLRENLKWSDGEALTADDVVFTFNKLYLNPEIPTSSRDTLRIGQSGDFPEVKKLNERQVEFILPEPFAPFFSTIGKAIFPEHILAATVEEKDENDKPIFLSTWAVDTPPEKIIGNSAYNLKEYKNSQRVIFVENPYYWKKGDRGEDLPKIEKVVWEIVESTDTSFLQFRSGSLDSLSVSPEFFSLLKKEEKRGNFTIYNGGAAYGNTYITFNLNKGTRNGKPLVDPIKSEWFNNLNFRKAVAYSLDRQRMINNLYRGLGEPQTSPISVQAPFYYDGLKGYDYNLDKAKELLIEAGFKYNDRGELFDSKGNRVKFSLSSNAGNKIREALASQIQQDLAKIGIQVDLNLLAFNLLVDKLGNTLEWESTLLGFTGGNEPNNGANIWAVDGNLHMFNQNREGIENREVSDWELEIGQLFIDASKELDFAKRKAIYAEFQSVVEDKVPFIYLVTPLSLGAVRNNIEPIEYSALGGAFWNLEELKISDR